LASPAARGPAHFHRVKRAGVLRVILSFVLGLLAGATAAQDDEPQAGTARDLIIKADRAYNERRHAEAVTGYEAFLRDFGAAEEAKADLPHVRYNLAAALMQTQKFDAAVEAIEEAQKFEDLAPERKENLAFWRGVAVLQLGDNAKAREALEEFMVQFPKSRRREDAALMAATALMVGGKNAEAAAQFAAIRGNPESIHRGRAAVLELHNLLETGQDRAALELLAAEGPRQDRLTQIATFQTLAMALGGKYLEEEKPREAIRALQTVWSHDRLTAHQQRRLEEVEEQLADLEARPAPDIFERAQARQVAREVEEELKNLEKIPSFDASVRFRLASAFHQQDRFRETALLLDDMLREMPPDPLVEQASLTALQSWMAIERHDKAVESAQLFAGRFPQSEQLPLVLYLQGVAQQQAQAYEAALATFQGVVEKFPATEQAQRALFMQAFTLLLAERNGEAAELFAAFRAKHPGSELGESAAYWQGSALAFAQQFPEAREVLAALPEQYPGGALLGPAAFRHAYCAQSMRDYERAEEELEAYLRAFPDGEESAEAKILLGDALLAQAKSDEGKEVYASVPAEAGRFHEEAQFKLAKVLRLEEDYEGLRALMQGYLAAYPNRSRAAEALFLIGTAWRQEDQLDKAREEYWAAIRKFGNDPEAYSVEDLFLALGRLYPGESEQLDYLADLRTLRTQAEAEDQTVLAVRAIWALAQAVKKSDPDLSQALLREASVMVAPPVTSPAVLSDCAEAQMLAAAEADPAEATRRRELAAGLYRDLLKWHPRAPQKDKALGALAKLALERDDIQTALDYYGRLERDVPWSPLMGEVLTTRARLEVDEGRPDEAVDSYTRLLAAENVPGKLKAQALLALGELEMQRNQPAKAIPYYQRIYILYGKWRDAVARAYLRSGEAFEQIDDLEAARKTYEELVNSEDLASLPEAEQAREKLKRFAPSPEASSS
jgi:outer membrane protein assembly factor BamD (BamD/ComL family)